MHSIPRIAVTMGDPAGVGPEVCLQLLADPAIAKECVPVLFGDAAILRRVAEAAKQPLQAPILTPEQWKKNWKQVAQPSVLDLQTMSADAVEPGKVSAATGKAGFTYVDRAIDAALAGQVAAVSTAPLNKEALHSAGIQFPGHTEIFAARTHAS